MTQSTFKFKIILNSSYSLKKFLTSEVAKFGSFFAAYVVEVLQEIYYLMNLSLKQTLISVTTLSHYAVTREVCKTLVTFFSIWTIFQSTVMLVLFWRDNLNILQFFIWKKFCHWIAERNCRKTCNRFADYGEEMHVFVIFHFQCNFSAIMQLGAENDYKKPDCKKKKIFYWQKICNQRPENGKMYKPFYNFLQMFLSIAVSSDFSASWWHFYLQSRFATECKEQLSHSCFSL